LLRLVELREKGEHFRGEWIGDEAVVLIDKNTPDRDVRLTTSEFYTIAGRIINKAFLHRRLLAVRSTYHWTRYWLRDVNLRPVALFQEESATAPDATDPRSPKVG
jgi:hypothetical protein